MPILTNIQSLEDIPTFNIVKEEIFDSRGERIPKTFSLMREDTRNHMGLCKADYRPIQLNEMIDVVDTACNTIGGIKHDGYTMLNDGQRVMVRSVMPNIEGISDDRIQGHFYTIIDNTGKSANKTVPSTLRLICDNQLNLLNSERHKNVNKNNAEGSSNANIRHSFTFDQKVKAFADNIRHNMNILTNFNKTAEQLRNASYSIDEMIQLTQRLLPSVNGETSQVIKKRESIVELYKSGKGNEGKTRWDALNAFTEFESNQKFTPAKLFRSLIGHTVSNKALNILCDN